MRVAPRDGGADGAWHLPHRARLLGALLVLSACAGPEDQGGQHLAAGFDQANAGLRAMQAGRQPWDAPPPAPPAASAPAAPLARATPGGALNPAFPGGPPGPGFTAPAPGAEATLVPGATRLDPAVPPASFPAARDWRPGAPMREAATLVGAPAEQVLASLGEPELRRPEGDSEAWLYRGQRCLLDVVLYPDPITRRPRVGHAAARSAGVARVTEEVCLSDIAQGRVLARLR